MPLWVRDADADSGLVLRTIVDLGEVVAGPSVLALDEPFVPHDDATTEDRWGCRGGRRVIPMDHGGCAHDVSQIFGATKGACHYKGNGNHIPLCCILSSVCPIITWRVPLHG